MTTAPRLTIVTLGTRDLDAMAAFYENVGLRASITMPTFRAYVVGGVALSLFPLEELAAEAGAADAAAPGDWRGVTLAMNVDAREDVTPAWQAWVDAGATAVTEPEDRDWGGRSGYVADPEGNRWEIAWAPSAVFGDRGDLVSFG